MRLVFRALEVIKKQKSIINQEHLSHRDKGFRMPPSVCSARKARDLKAHLLISVRCLMGLECVRGA